LISDRSAVGNQATFTTISFLAIHWSIYQQAFTRPTGTSLGLPGSSRPGTPSGTIVFEFFMHTPMDLPAFNQLPDFRQLAPGLQPHFPPLA